MAPPWIFAPRGGQDTGLYVLLDSDGQVVAEASVAIQLGFLGRIKRVARIRAGNCSILARTRRRWFRAWTEVIDLADGSLLCWLQVWISGGADAFECQSPDGTRLASIGPRSIKDAVIEAIGLSYGELVIDYHGVQKFMIEPRSPFERVHVQPLQPDVPEPKCLCVCVLLMMSRQMMRRA